MQIEEQYKQHIHDGVGTKKIKVTDIIPSYVMTSAELTVFTSQSAQTGEMFTNFDGTNYKIYVYLNGAWKSATLS